MRENKTTTEVGAIALLVCGRSPHIPLPILFKFDGQYFRLFSAVVPFRGCKAQPVASSPQLLQEMTGVTWRTAERMWRENGACRGTGDLGMSPKPLNGESLLGYYFLNNRSVALLRAIRVVFSLYAVIHVVEQM